MRTYICEELQKRLNNDLMHITLDTTDYTLEQDFLKDKKDEKAAAPEQPDKSGQTKDNASDSKEENATAQKEQKTESKEKPETKEAKDTSATEQPAAETKQN